MKPQSLCMTLPHASPQQWQAAFGLGPEVACTAKRILTRFFSRRLPSDDLMMDFLGERMPFGPALAAASLFIACKLHERYE